MSFNYLFIFRKCSQIKCTKDFNWQNGMNELGTKECQKYLNQLNSTFFKRFLSYNTNVKLVNT